MDYFLPLVVCLMAVPFVTVPASGFEYLGCYIDRYKASERDLQGSVFLQSKMSPSICEPLCGDNGFPYFGLQFGGECWCGKSYGRYNKVEDAECVKPCTGDPQVKCGGDLRNSMYKVDGSKVRKPEALKRKGEGEAPLLALLMIVKDEAHTLPNTLMPLKPYIDTYYILDTGSTDGTPEVIRRTLSDMKGYIFKEPFVDYGTSRNRIMDLAAASKNPPVFGLMLSADETVYNAAALRKWVEEHRTSVGPMHEAYPLVMDVGWKFDSVRLSRTSAKWRYVGRVHEYLAPPDKGWRDTLRVPEAYIRFHITDPERRKKREFTILRILMEDKERQPKDGRTSFYLARTFNAVGNHSAALAEFQRRVSLGGWKEEVYESLFAIAWQKKHLNRPWHEVQQAFLDAHMHSPDRAEPLYNIADHWLVTGQPSLAFMFAMRAAQLPYPKNAVLWVQENVYSWQCRYILGMTAIDSSVGQLEIGARALIEALKVQPQDIRMVNKLKLYQAIMSPAQWASVQDPPGQARGSAQILKTLLSRGVQQGPPGQPHVGGKTAQQHQGGQLRPAAHSPASQSSPEQSHPNSFAHTVHAQAPGRGQWGDRVAEAVSWQHWAWYQFTAFFLLAFAALLACGAVMFRGFVFVLRYAKLRKLARNKAR